MTVRRLIAVTVLLVLVAVDVCARAEMPHVRAVDPWLAERLAGAYAASATLRRLVDRLQRSDVIVHIESRSQRMANVGGILQLVTHAAGYRYLRVTIHVRSLGLPTVYALGSKAVEERAVTGCR